MSTDLNTVSLVGRLVRDPEMRTTSAGQYVTRFGIANSRYVKDPSGNGWKQQTSFFNIIVWGDQALRCHNELRKGSQVAVSGRLEQRSWQDKDNQKHSAVEVVAASVQEFMRDNANNQQRGYEQQPTQDYNAPPQNNYQPPAQNNYNAPAE